MNITVTTLVENTVPSGKKGLIGEHGLSFFIETGCQTLLFDTGQGRGLLNNAAVLDLDLNSVDTVVLSHGHYDHAGGVPAFAGLNKRFTLIAHPAVYDDKLIRDKTAFRNIGMPFDQQYLQDRNCKLRLEKASVEICPGVMTTGEIPMVTDFEAVESGFYIRKQGRVIPDPMADDQALILDTPKGLVVLLGCSHRGIINTLEHVLTLTGRHRIHAIMGGLHLGNVSDAGLKPVVESLRKFKIMKMVVGHCTGMRAIIRLFNEFPGSVTVNTVGHTMVF